MYEGLTSGVSQGYSGEDEIARRNTAFPSMILRELVILFRCPKLVNNKYTIHE